MRKQRQIAELSLIPRRGTGEFYRHH